MKIVVCLKQVPDTKGGVQFNPDGTLNRAAMLAIMNPDDKAGLEAALRIKDECGAEVTVITMGLPKATDVLMEALAMGADKAILVSAREFGGSDTYATSQILAAAVNKIGVDKDDIVFCGRQAIDGDTAQVGPQIAEKLNLPQITYAADIKKDGDKITVKRLLEDGHMMLTVETPCLITCVQELNKPRYMTLDGITSCYSKPYEVYDFETLKNEPLIDPDTIGLQGSPTNVYKSFSPPPKGGGIMLEGNGQETCDQLANMLNEKHII